MIKKTITILLYTIITILIAAVYLTYFGIETKRFNETIKEKISENNKNIQIELNKVKIVFNPTNFTLAVKTINPNIIIDDKKIKLEKISTNLSVRSLLQKEFLIKNAKIISRENNLNNIIDAARVIKNSPQIFILNQMVKEGKIFASIDLYFDDKGKIKKNYKIKGLIKNGKIRLINKKNISNINFNFEINDKNYLLENAKIQHEKIKFSSKKIEVRKENNFFLIDGDFLSEEVANNSSLLAFIFKSNLKKLGIDSFNFTTNNNFSFKLSKKIKISDLKVDSKIDLKNLIYINNNNFLKKSLSNYNNLIELRDHKIELSYYKKNLKFKGNGKIMIDNEHDKINYEFQSNNGKYNFKSQIQLINIPFQLKFLNFSKKKNENSLLEVEGVYNENKKFYKLSTFLKENENTFKISGINLNQNYKINSIDEISLYFINDNKKQNKVLFQKKGNNYKLYGKLFDGNNLLNSKKDGNFFNIFNNLNSNVEVSFDKIFIDDVNYLNNLNGNLKFEKNILNNANLKANLPGNKKIRFTVKTNQNNQKITTLFSEYAKPLVRRYKFIKGFEEGSIDFQSIKKKQYIKFTVKNL